MGKYLNGYGLDDPERVPQGWSEWNALHRADHAELLRLRRQRGRDDRPLRHRSRGLQEPRDRPPGGRRDPPRGPRQPAAVPLRRLQRAPRPEHPGAPRRRQPRRGDRAAQPRVRRGRPRRQAEVPARPPAARRGPRWRGSTRATSARSSRWPRSTARSRRSSTRCGPRTSSATPTSSSPRDNGYLDGEHRIEFGKPLAYEPSSHVPLLVRGPGLPAGETSDALVGNIDLAPTIAEIASGEAQRRGRRPLAAAARPHPGPSTDRALLLESLGARPLDLLRLPVRGGPRRPLPLRPLPDR